MSNLLAIIYLNRDKNIQVVVVNSNDYNETAVKEAFAKAGCEFTEAIQVFPDEVITTQELINSLE